MLKYWLVLLVKDVMTLEEITRNESRDDSHLDHFLDDVAIVAIFFESAEQAQTACVSRKRYVVPAASPAAHLPQIGREGI